MRSEALATAFVLALLAPPPAAQRLDRLREMLPPQAFTPTTYPFGSVVAADLDVDGDLDLVGLESSRVVAFLNDGTGRFGDRVVVTAPAFLLFGLVVADLTGDGLPDVLRDDGALYVQGPGLSFTERTSGVPPSQNSTYELLDLEGDGDLDVLVFSFAGPYRLYRNDGSGSFEDVSAHLPFTTATSVAVLDADGDGDPDLLRVGSGTQLLRNDGEGNFAVENQPFHLNGYSTVVAVDVEGDGDEDVVLRSGSWAENDGTGKFTARGNLISTATGLFLDFDGDGRLDVVGTSLGPEGGLYAWRGVAPASFVQVSSPTLDRFAGKSVALVAGDFDGDGDDDLMVESTRPCMLWSGRNGWELALVRPEAVEDDYLGLWTHDLNGDGVLDGLGIAIPAPSLFSLSSEERFVWLPGERNGAFGAPRDVTPEGEWTAAGAIDLENDGVVDALLVSESEARAYRFDPSALWEPARNAVSVRSAAGSGPTVADVLVGDLNADGFEDAVVLGTETGGSQTPDYVLLNDGRGELVDAAAGLPITLFRGDLGDLDRDGDLDFVALGAGSTATYLNRGDGRFDAAAQALTLKTARAGLAVVDLDGSGTLDLALLVNLPQAIVRIHAGLGDGAFDPTPAATLPRQASVFLVPAFLATPDVDADGLPDLYLPEPYAGTFWANRGAFTFEDRSATLPPLPLNEGGSPLAWGDFDRDGDDDVWLPGETQVLWSLRRQLSFATWPRAGKPLEMDLSGSPGAPWSLFASTGTGSTPTPAGIFLLDPTEGLAIASGVLDANGDASLTLQVPEREVFVGLRVYWQALVGSPLRFTNLETTTLSPF